MSRRKRRLVCACCARLKGEAQSDRPWRKRKLTVRPPSRLPPALAGAFGAEAAAAAAEWGRHCGLTLAVVSSGGDVRQEVGKIDGKGRTLGYSGVGPPGPVRQVYDLDEDWGNDVDLRAVILHELGHALGLYHGSRGSAMAAYYEGHRELQGEDVERIQALYGPPTGGGSPGGAPDPVVIRVYGAERIEIPGYDVRRAG